MSQLIARIMLAIFMLPCAAVVYVMAVVLFDEYHLFAYPVRRYGIFVVAGAVAWLFITAYWVLLWRTSVRWTPLRVQRTMIASAVALALGCMAAAMIMPLEDDIAAWFGSVVAPLVWLIGTTFVWRETADERASRVTGRSALTCPTCGYNLTGLQSTRCPECGTQFTLEDLLARQKSATEADLTS